MSNNLIVMLLNKLKESKQMSRTSKSIQNQYKIKPQEVIQLHN